MTLGVTSLAQVAAVVHAAHTGTLSIVVGAPGDAPTAGSTPTGGGVPAAGGAGAAAGSSTGSSAGAGGATRRRRWRVSSADRWVVLGLARPRTPWFGEVSQLGHFGGDLGRVRQVRLGRGGPIQTCVGPAPLRAARRHERGRLRPRPDRCRSRRRYSRDRSGATAAVGRRPTSGWRQCYRRLRPRRPARRAATPRRHGRSHRRPARRCWATIPCRCGGGDS